MKKAIMLILGLSLLAAVSAAAAPPKASDPGKPVSVTVHVQNPLVSVNSDLQETSLGDLIADAVAETGQAPLALVAADEIIPVTITPGAVPATQIVKALRYADDPSDTIVVLQVTGAQLLKATERGVARAPQPFDGFLQFSGLQLHYDPTQIPGKRVTSAKIGGVQIAPNKTYRVATTRPIAEGSLGYFRVWNKKNIVQDTNITVSQGLTNYLSAHSTVNATVEGRITTP